MAWFKKRSTPDAPPAAPVPIVITDDDLAHLATLLAQFEAGVGSDPHTRSAVLAIATAGGALSLEDGIRLAASTGQVDIDRPWRWLGQAAEAAQRRGNWELIAHIGLFASMFMTSFAPHLTLADQLDMRLSGGSPQSLGRIYSVVLEVLPGTPQEVVVVDHPTGTLRVGDVLALCVAEAVKLAGGLLTPRAAAYAAATAG